MKTRGYYVLVVDDDEVIRELLSSALSSKGHNCDTASDGVQALERCNSNRYDAVISDIVMPEMDGLLMTTHLNSKYPDMPVMLMTGFVNEYVYDDALKAGACDFINKPISMEEFFARFDKMMNNCETLSQLKTQEVELENISRQMINGIENDAMEKIADLEKRLAELKNKISTQ
ncbi:MAG: response regulator [Nitrospirae bacterium]|nr:response regulator [Nitrospirota bacterium]